MAIAMKGLMQLKNPVEEASYIVFTDGSRYYAKNGSTGIIEYSDVDATKVIQYAVDRVGEQGGGKVFIKRGMYSISGTISITKDGVIIVGEGFVGLETPQWGTVLKMSSGVNKDMFDIYARKVMLKDFTIDMNLNSGRAIYAHRGAPEDLRLRDIYIINVNATAIWDNGWHGSYIGVTIEKVRGHPNYAIWLEGDRNFLSHITLYSVDYGIYLKGNRNFISSFSIFNSYRAVTIVGNYNVLADGIIHGPANDGIVIQGATGNLLTGLKIYMAGWQTNNTYDAINIQSYGTTPSRKNIIIGNHIFSDYTNLPKYCVEEVDPNQDYNIILYNVFEGWASGAVRKQGLNTVVRGNIGYVTENSGVATISAGSTRVTVSHGLANAPSKVLITPLGQPPNKLWVENITSTSFDIVTDTAPTADLNVSWQAEV